MGMRVVVSSPGPSLVLAYAEYRFLSVLARHQDVRSARVTLRSGADATVLCSVRITFDPSGSARARVSGEYAAAAIERAVDRVGQLMRDRRWRPPARRRPADVTSCKRHVHVEMRVSEETAMQKPIDMVIHAASSQAAQTLREFVTKRLSFVLRPFEHQVRRVKVRLSDLNGPKRGVDTECLVAVELNDGRRVLTTARTAVPFAAVCDAASRMRESLRRELGLRRPIRRGAEVRP
jgi:putative sigma-54 modulation protein